MKYKLLATDLDWSLVYDRNKINNDNLLSIKKFLNDGYYFCVITGRPLFTAEPLMKEFSLTNYKNFYLCCYNGGVVYHPYSNKVIYKSGTISIDEAKKVYEITKKYKVNLLMYKDEKVYIDELFTYNDLDESIGHLDIKKIKINDLNNNLIKAIVASDNDKLLEIEPILKEKFPTLDFFLSQKFFLEVMKKGVNKAVSIDFLSSYLNISTDEMIVIGDSYNDIFMLNKVKKSVAVKNASEDIKNAVSEITKDVHDDHIKSIIDKYFI